MAEVSFILTEPTVGKFPTQSTHTHGLTQGASGGVKEIQGLKKSSCLETRGGVGVDVYPARDQCLFYIPELDLSQLFPLQVPHSLLPLGPSPENICC